MRPCGPCRLPGEPRPTAGGGGILENGCGEVEGHSGLGQQEQGGVCDSVCVWLDGGGEPWVHRGEKVGGGKVGWKFSSCGEALTLT